MLPRSPIDRPCGSRLPETSENGPTAKENRRVKNDWSGQESIAEYDPYIARTRVRPIEVRTGSDLPSSLGKYGWPRGLQVDRTSVQARPPPPIRRPGSERFRTVPQRIKSRPVGSGRRDGDSSLRSRVRVDDPIPSRDQKWNATMAKSRISNAAVAEPETINGISLVAPALTSTMGDRDGRDSAPVPRRPADRASVRQRFGHEARGHEPRPDRRHPDGRAPRSTSRSAATACRAAASWKSSARNPPARRR